MQPTFVLLLALEQPAKVGRKDASQASSSNDVRQDGKGVLVAFRVGPQLVGVEASIYDGIGPLPCQLCQALGELGDVLADALLWILHLPVDVGQLVVCLQQPQEALEQRTTL